MPAQDDSHIRKALIIEDDDIDFYAMQRAIRKNTIKFECDHVRFLAEAIALVKENSYEIILTDMNLPDSHGLETITSLLSAVGKVPIVVLSGTDDDVIALEAVHIGAQDYIPKQYIGDTGLINRTLCHAIERHQLKLGIEKIRDRERFLAHYDQCTSLPNRLLFLDRLHQAVMQAQRNQNEFAIFFVDLDRFKHINDTVGHAAGDEVLRCVGKRMRDLIRDSDTVARFGGDEFVLILHLSDNNSAMYHLAEKLIEEINKPIPFGHHSCNVGASIGIAFYPNHGDCPEHLIKNADIAMYEAKNKGRNQVQFFTQDLYEQRSHYLNLEKALHDALNKPEKNFELHFQPRVDLTSGKVQSVESLLRWHHPKLGNIPPSQFIPLAEDVGLIESIDAWVLEAACKRVHKWREIESSIYIGINISGRSFNQPYFVNDVVKPLLKKYNIKERRLEMEITESVLLNETRQVLEHLNALKKLGVSLAIDDFGTGFSSLSYLNNFPIDTLKIDGSFICDNNSNKSEKALLKAIIALGNALHMKVVAECVETEAQQEYLCSLNCDEGQGFYWCEPRADWTPEKKDNVIPIHNHTAKHS